MATITTRAGKGSPLTNTELDANFTNLNTDKLETSGGTLTGNLSFGDNDKAIFGAGSDLQIYHDGSNSYVKDNGTGYLILGGANTGVIIREGEGNDLLTTSATDIQLGYDGSTKLSTTSTGINVTGTVTADGLTVDGSIDLNGQLDIDTNALPAVIVTDTSIGRTLWYGGSDAHIFDTDGYIRLETADNSRLKIDADGDISFYEDTGTTPKFFWDASAESLGIGTSSPLDELHVSSSTPAIRLSDTDAASGGYGRITCGASGNVIFYADPTDVEAASYMAFNVDGSEAIRIDSDGNVGIGTSSVDSLLTVEKDFGNVSGSSAVALQIGNVSTVTSQTPGTRLLFNSGNRESGAIDVNHNTAGGDNASMNFVVRDGSNTMQERMRIDSSGRVGISTSSPFRSLTIAGTGEQLQLNLNSGTNGDFSSIVWNGSASGLPTGEASAEIRGYRTAAGALGALTFHTRSVTTSDERMRIDSSGNVGIGLDNPSRKLQVRNNSSTAYNPSTAALNAVVNIQNNTSGASNNALLSFTTESNGEWYIGGVQNSGNTASDFVFTSRNSGTRAERMRIDSSGNVLVGKTSSSFSTVGVEATSTGKIRATMSSDNPISLNRTTTDGDIAVFAKDGATVGSIGTWDGDFAIGQVNVAFKFDDGGNQILPWSVSSNLNRDNAVDLGDSTSRWKDLYLSGGVYLGGTGSANHLDDYEVGTWTPILEYSGGGSGITYTSQNGFYVKVGDFVHLGCRLRLSNKGSGTGGAYIKGLPFNLYSDSAYRVGGSLAYLQNLGVNVSQLAFYADGNSNARIGLYYTSAAGSSSLTQIDSTGLTNTSNFQFSISYRVV